MANDAVVNSVEALARSLQIPFAIEADSSQELPAGLQKQQKYVEMFRLCNGGYTADFLYHFFGRSGPAAHNVIEWNRRDLWKRYYGLDENAFVFAEDVLGNQFFFTLKGPRNVVKALWNEDGKTSVVAEDFTDFILGVVASEEDNEPMRDLFRKFLTTTGRDYPPLHHLSHKVPTSLGGADADLANLEFVDSISNLQFYGQVSAQIRGLPAGTRIKDILIDKERGTVRLVT